VSSFANLITDRLRPALAALLTAFDYAADSGLDRWEFAVEMDELLAAGAKLADLRWLIRRGLAEHAKETTIPGDPTRAFRPLAPTSFPDDACLTLTLLGAAKLRPFVQQDRQDAIDSRPENAKFAPSLATGSENLKSGDQQSEAPLAGSLASPSANPVAARRVPSGCDHATPMAQNGERVASPSSDHATPLSRSACGESVARTGDSHSAVSTPNGPAVSREPVERSNGPAVSMSNGSECEGGHQDLEAGSRESNTT
jgi:hypothetical protein